MKILICGKRKSGKSSLLNRLKGRPHESTYVTSTEVVQAVTVNWNYKSTSDVAKVDAWEIQGKIMYLRLLHAFTYRGVELIRTELIWTTF